jgi:hypothetical protein
VRNASGEKLMNRRRYLIIVGIVVAAALVAVLWQTVLANHRPAIAGLEAPEMVVPSGTCQVVCIASDPDGDALSYNWSASGGSISGGGAAINWTAPELLGSYNVAVRVTDGRGEEVAKQIAIEVRANRAPTIDSLLADIDWTTPSGTIQLTCAASDPDDDVLTYQWTATAGDISGTGSVVNWTAPQEVGVYNVTVVVKDGHESEDTLFVPLSVNLATPPTVEKLIVTPIDNIYLRNCTDTACDFDVWKTRAYDIKCVAPGAGEVFYDWSCTDGDISGTGSNITWTAPNKYSSSTVSVDATVTVMVSDGAGNTAVKNIVFHVPTCSCGSWGLRSGEISF